jgi:hypothetical protein
MRTARVATTSDPAEGEEARAQCGAETSASTHTALTKDEWRKSVRRDRGAELGVEESTGSGLG